MNPKEAVRKEILEAIAKLIPEKPSKSHSRKYIFGLQAAYCAVSTLVLEHESDTGGY